MEVGIRVDESEVERLRGIMERFLENRLALEKTTANLAEGQLLPQHAIGYRDQMREALKEMAVEIAKGK